MFLYYLLIKGLLIKYTNNVIIPIKLITMDNAGKRRSINPTISPGPGSDAPNMEIVDIIRKNTPVIIAARENDSNLPLFLNINIHRRIETGIHMKNSKTKFQNIRPIS
jgi:hypothetical protein